MWILGLKGLKRLRIIIFLLILVAGERCNIKAVL